MNRPRLAQLSGGGLIVILCLNTIFGIAQIGFFVHQVNGQNYLTRADLSHAYASFTAARGWQWGESTSGVLVGRVLQLALSNRLPVDGLQQLTTDEKFALGGSAIAEGISRNPADSWAWFKLAEIYRGYQSGRLRLDRLRASDDVARAGALSATAPGEATFEPEDPLVIAATLKAQELDPEFFFYHDFLATLYWRRGFPEAASREIEESFALMPMVSSHGLLRRDELIRELPEAALRGLTRARSHPVIPADFVELARADLLERLGRREDAIASLERARVGMTGLQVVEIELRIGTMLHGMKRDGESLPYLERVVRADRDGELGTRALYPLGIGRSRSGDHEGAIEALRTHLERKPERWHPYVALARAYAAAGRPRDTESLYRAAMERFPSRREVHRGWVEFLESQGRLEEALAASHEFGRVAPDSGAAALADRIRQKLDAGVR